jgi:MoaA/NifB/PqqE/SkfB family radical SAM enzyme
MSALHPGGSMLPFPIGPAKRTEKRVRLLSLDIGWARSYSTETELASRAPQAFPAGRLAGQDNHYSVTLKGHPMADKLPAYLPERFQRIHLELTNRCNFSCVFCPDGKMTRKRGIMEPAVAYATLDQIADLDLAEKVTFHVMGEPLLHPQFFDILDHAKRGGIAVGLTTNGALLRPQTIRKLAERDLYQIDISLQTPDSESFQATRGCRVDFEHYRNGLLDLLAACATRPEPPVFKIRVMTTRFAGALRNRLGISDFMGSSESLHRTVREWVGLIYERLGVQLPDQAILAKRIKQIGIRAWNVIEVSPKIFIETYILTDWGNAFSEEEIIEADHGYCFGMRDHFAILHTGDVVLCCIDFDGRTVLGNLRETSLREILESDRLRTIMEGFQRGALVHPHCRRCLGSTSRLGSWVKPVASLVGLKLLKPFFYKKYRLFD